ncbi:MAG: hypothetical protein NTZ12_11160 [Candidatus Aminicenantes bacterium]|nr:hypothetical protein [Candidatus Aminicenantes bacterium]
MNIVMQMANTLNQKGAALEMNLNPELRVPKREVPAEISFTFAPETLCWCYFYLSFYSPRRNGEESLAEHLNSGQSFFPMRDKANKEFFIVHVDQILYVREAVLMEIKTGRPLNLHLDRGTMLRASLPESQRAWQARPIDMLNEAVRFMAFVQDDHTRLYVNKDHIARVEGL